jgi:glutamyl-tRNA reductase
MERLLGRLDALDEEDRREVEAFGRRLLNKLLHEPTVAVRKEASEGRAQEVVRAARTLFGLGGTGLARENAESPRSEAPEPGAPDPTPSSLEGS